MTTKITPSVFAVGVLNPALRVFDIVMKTEFGTTYNAYLVKGSEKTALIETCHETFFDQFVENLNEVCKPAAIDYIILNHTEPDHSGALRRLAEICPNATIVASQAGSIYLKGITNNSALKIQVAKDGDSISLGNMTLNFISAPFLHWPDSMFTWLPEEKVIFTCDFLGAHYCEPYVFDYNTVYPQKYEQGFKAYYDAIFAPFKQYVLAGLAKIEKLPIDFLCTSHGPVLTKDGRLSYAKENYATWSAASANAKKKIPIFYTSAYGNTGKIAQAIAKGVREILPDAEVDIYDIIETDMHFLHNELAECTGFAIGTPTINRDAVPPCWELLSHIDAIGCQKKPCLAFGSYGWSGEGVPNLITRLQSLKLKVVGGGLKINFVPTPEDLEIARQQGAALAAVIQ